MAITIVEEEIVAISFERFSERLVRGPVHIFCASCGAKSVVQDEDEADSGSSSSSDSSTSDSDSDSSDDSDSFHCPNADCESTYTFVDASITANITEQCVTCLENWKVTATDDASDATYTCSSCGAGNIISVADSSSSGDDEAEATDLIMTITDTKIEDIFSEKLHIHEELVEITCVEVNE